VNDLEFCEDLDLDTLADQIAGGRTDLLINSPLLPNPIRFQLTGSPFGGAIANRLINLFGKDTVFAVNKPNFQLGFQFVAPKKAEPNLSQPETVVEP
jgi:hypothetical protein